MGSKRIESLHLLEYARWKVVGLDRISDQLANAGLTYLLMLTHFMQVTS